ncbi:hypothetical protein FFZ99_00070 [Leptospira interrogans]|nr:hypothetical protein B2G47_09315 [Leptospira interrogans serovar Canicola]KGE26549.1 hypothetical protein IQ65_11685 [Leptospira interrogans serovar Lai]KYZ61596.1 hypothetical protein AWU66_06645 [Leptospira interrogans serovar Pomona]OQM28354.1 hypothetical protein DV30_17550 [Leptospira interrogans serovar Canicola str. Gui44]OQM29843.1 hypothetical protein DV38_11515 [Leptospira interrogans]
MALQIVRKTVMKYFTTKKEKTGLEKKKYVQHWNSSHLNFQNRFYNFSVRFLLPLNTLVNFNF